LIVAADISVTTTETSDGWDADVVVEDADGGTTEHRVGVKRGDWERLTGGRGDVAELVRRSFAFLLEREPKESILRRFDLMVIGRYFPGYEGEIRAGDW
jgi:hypothetical protein